MTPIQSKNSSKLADQVKVWLFPALVTMLATITYREVLEIRSDVKQLLAQSNIDKTKIENLEKDVRMLDQAVFNKKITASTNESDEQKKTLDLLADIRYFKPEEEFDINKYVPKS